MSSFGLNIGLRALLTSQSALETIGHNVSNANTPGYSRQSLQVSTAPALLLRGLLMGSGVDADRVMRTADDLLTRRITTQLGSLQELEARLDGLSQVESLFAEPGERGLNSILQGFFTSVSALASAPGDAPLRAGLVQAAQSLTGRFRELSGGLSEAQSSLQLQIVAQVDRANGLARQIASLNEQVRYSEANQVTANDLRDQRDRLLRELGSLIDIQYVTSAQGTVTVSSNGAVLVGTSRAYALTAKVMPGGNLSIRAQGIAQDLHPRGGAIGGLLRLADELVPDLGGRVDTLARQLILEANRAHSTGLPAGGPMRSLTSANSLRDTDGDGSLGDELLANAGLPFEITAGSLYVNVTDPSTGAFTRHRIDVDPETTSVADFVGALNELGGLTANIDGQGRLHVQAAAGYGFDFGRRVQPAPDVAGTFGGGVASLGTQGGEPFALSGGSTLDVNGPGGPFTITFLAGDFADIANATAEEIAAAINSNPATAANGMRAAAVGGNLYLQTLDSGASESFTVTGGSALAALGWTAGTSAAGHDTAVTVELGGQYTGAANGRLRFVPSGDGIVGTTPGLAVNVLDASGAVVATLDVGAGYVPGTELALPDGLSVSFGLGHLSASDGDAFVVEALADSDTSDVLVALGLNALFTGSGAADIGLRADLEADPRGLAASLTGEAGDNGVLHELLALQQTGLAGLDGRSASTFYGEIVGDVGFQVESAGSAHDVEQFLMESLEERREQIAGVNVDEELVDMLRYEQAYSAAAQFIQVVNRMQEEVLSLL